LFAGAEGSPEAGKIFQSYMYQRDYILRMIEMLRDFIAGIFGLLKKGDFKQASLSLQNAYYDFLKQDAAFFRKINKEQLTDELIGIHNYTNGHLEILSELFYVEAEILFAEARKQESLEYYEKALLLSEFLEKETKIFSLEKQNRKVALKNRIVEIKDTGS
jgi:hypothetical protein